MCIADIFFTWAAFSGSVGLRAKSTGSIATVIMSSPLSITFSLLPYKPRVRRVRVIGYRINHALIFNIVNSYVYSADIYRMICSVYIYDRLISLSPCLAANIKIERVRGKGLL